MRSMRNGALVVAALAVFAGSALPALGQCDTADPGFSSFGFAPGAINTTAASQNVTCTIAVTDALAGASSVGCQFQSPSGQKAVSCAANR